MLRIRMVQNIPDNHADYSVFLFARWVSMGGRIEARNYLDQFIHALPKSKPPQEQQQMHLKLCKNDMKIHLVQLWQAQKKREVRKMCPDGSGSFVHYIERGGPLACGNSANVCKGRATIFPLQWFLFCRRKRSQRAPGSQIQSLAVDRRWKRWVCQCLDRYRYETEQIAKRLIFLKYFTRA